MVFIDICFHFFHYAVYAVNEPVAGFDTDRDSFLGAYRSPSDPEVVELGASKNTVASGWSPIGSFQLKATLQPGEEVSYVFVLGYIENPVAEKWESLNVINKKPAHAMLERYNTVEKADAALAAAEYDRDTLYKEYMRDVAAGIDIQVPANYFPDDDPSQMPLVKWRSCAHLLYTNWLNYCVYQTSPYDIRDIKKGIRTDD